MGTHRSSSHSNDDSRNRIHRERRARWWRNRVERTAGGLGSARREPGADGAGFEHHSQSATGPELEEDGVSRSKQKKGRGGRTMIAMLSC